MPIASSFFKFYVFTYPIRVVQGRAAERLIAVSTAGGVGRVLRRVDSGVEDRPDGDEPRNALHLC
jgi:hypothetical protein